MFGFTTVEEDLNRYMHELEEAEKEEQRYWAEKIPCDECGLVLERYDMKEMDGDYLCEDCFSLFNE